MGRDAGGFLAGMSLEDSLPVKGVTGWLGGDRVSGGVEGTSLLLAAVLMMQNALQRHCGSDICLILLFSRGLI